MIDMCRITDVLQQKVEKNGIKGASIHFQINEDKKRWNQMLQQYKMYFQCDQTKWKSNDSKRIWFKNNNLWQWKRQIVKMCRCVKREKWDRQWDRVAHQRKTKSNVTWQHAQCSTMLTQSKRWRARCSIRLLTRNTRNCSSITQRMAL